MYPGVELRVMRYFLAVVAEMHFTRAAERVHVAQPSLSKQIHNLEEELGVELLKRGRRHVELTEPGRVFAENARQALLYAERATAMARAAGTGKSGKLLIGISSATDSALYFRIRDAVNRQYPDVQMEAVTAPAIQLAEDLMRNELQASIVELPIRYRGLDVLFIFHEQLVWALSDKDSLASEKIIHAGQIGNRSLVLVSPDADLAYHSIVANLAKWGYRPPKVQLVSTSSQVHEFVAAGQGIGILRASGTRCRAAGITHRPAESLPAVDTGIAYRRGARPPSVRNFLRVVRQLFHPY
jgi:DNA-binding transcriptional LysR family regulator